MNRAEAAAALKDIRMCVTLQSNTQLLDLLYLPESGSLWALNSHLTSAFTAGASLIQIIKWLGGLLNVSGLFYPHFPL